MRCEECERPIEGMSIPIAKCWLCYSYAIIKGEN